MSRNTERALEAFLGPDADAIRAAAEQGCALGLPRSPTLDERIDLFIRAVHGPEVAQRPHLRAHARRRILDAMAADLLAERDDSQKEAVDCEASALASSLSPTVRTGTLRRALGAIQDLLRYPWFLSLSPGFRLTLPNRRLIAASSGLLFVVAAGWSAAWFYAAHRAENVLMGLMSERSSFGGAVKCASRGIGGYPFAIDLWCVRPRVTIATAQGNILIEARGVLAHAPIYLPAFVAADVVGPLAITAPHEPTIVADWTSARLRLAETKMPASLSLSADGLKLESLLPEHAEHLMTARHLALEARPASDAAVDKSALELSISLEGAVVAANQLLASETLKAEIAIVANELAPSVSIRDWQARGGRIKIEEARLQQGDHVLTAQGRVALNAAGRFDGEMSINASGRYAEIAQSIRREGLAGVTGRSRLSQSLQGLQPRALVLPGEQQQPNAPAASTPLGRVIIPQLEAAIRFHNGAVYLDQTLVGEIPPLF